ncbi:transcriptional regulator with XRE-family HTH domain [Actinoplanes octamycinicus]|uniref:Transcriptional regulator with XRE-family HTH domain n=1 Tax=Actinoplanes octamycinicus TaxID=135948 RepID=A0A7W7H1I7_9ACTN|nr:helix-turn-helix transcriptional regulator [Actinoplanes octamycinicus]MBB4742167.1 transcriptional regulator with XRE-family HTH domain [Actinoplanes octamycinicus]GIE59986.1 transcriptional regulator [Actinoplanes octamycinicus]
MSTGPTDESGNPSESPGAAIARMRRKAGITGQQLGQMTKMSQAKISRIETGQTSVSPEDVARLARALGASPEVTNRLINHAERVHNRMTDWRQTTGSVGGIQSEVARIEANTREFRVFQPGVMIGLVQTSEYARAILSSIDVVYGPRHREGRVTSVAEAVSARVARQEILVEPGRQFNFMLGEAALSSRVAKPIHMLGQIERLRQVAGQANVSLKFIPADATLPLPLIHGFELLDDTCVVIDAFNTAMMSRGPDDVASYRQVFDMLDDAATDDVEPLLEKYLRQYRDLAA